MIYIAPNHLRVNLIVESYDCRECAPMVETELVYPMNTAGWKGKYSILWRQYGGIDYIVLCVYIYIYIDEYSKRLNML